MTFHKLKHLFVLTVLFGSTAGCAVGQKQSFAKVQVAVSHQDTTTIALAAHDIRPYVIKGEKSPTYVGTLRGGFGNPFDVTTESGAPLALEFADALRRGLSAKGYKVSTVVVRARRTREQAIAALAQTKAARLILLSVNEWATDTYNSTDLSYDLTLEVLDGSGRVLARSAVSGDDRLGMSLFNPHGEAKKGAPEALRAKLGALVNDAKVAAALKAPATPPPGSARSPLREME